MVRLTTCVVAPTASGVSEAVSVLSTGFVPATVVLLPPLVRPKSKQFLEDSPEVIGENELPPVFTASNWYQYSVFGESGVVALSFESGYTLVTVVGIPIGS